MLADMFSGMYGMFKSDQLGGFLEKFKETMEEGDENLGIPVLEPFEREFLYIESNQNGLFSARGYLEDLRIDGLSDYTVKRADFPMPGCKGKVILLFHKIEIEALYKLRGTFLDENSFRGRGNLNLQIKKLKVTADLQLEIRGGRLYLSNLELETAVRKFDCDVSGLYVNDDLSEDVSETITDEAPNFLEEYQDEISQYVSNIARNLINDILRNHSFANMLDTIFG